MKTPVPTREAANSQQLGMLLAITQSLQSYLLEPPRQNIPEDGPLDGGTVAAAATTFIKTCGKIDELLADPSRWNLESQDALYDSLVQVHEQQRLFLQAQTAAAATILRPSFRLKPELHVVENGYAAIFGDLTTGNAVIGYGSTPEAAFEDFDAACNRNPKQQHKFVPDETPAEAKPKQKRKTK